MNSPQIESVATAYACKLTVDGIEPKRFVRDVSGIKKVLNGLFLFSVPSQPEALSHALWMCCEIKAHCQAGKTEKAHRWLGFVQAILWMCGKETIDDIKGHNRTPKSVPPP